MADNWKIGKETKYIFCKVDHLLTPIVLFFVLFVIIKVNLTPKFQAVENAQK